MPDSGIKLTKQASDMLASFTGASNKLTWILFVIDEEDNAKVIKVDSFGDDKAPYDLIREKLAAMMCGYAVFYHCLDCEESKNLTASQQPYPVFVRWADDKASINQKMVYSCSANTMQKCVGTAIKVALQVNEADDFARGCVFHEVKRQYKSHFSS